VVAISQIFPLFRGTKVGILFESTKDKYELRLIIS